MLKRILASSYERVNPDGLSLTAQIRQHKEYNELPIVRQIVSRIRFR
ncbi:MAG: hypothetical protein EBE86_005685 [Hormoscilla sp. GUM202]|nr:hypothetical protein [Hormoscilla sp. GUM202]